MSLSLYKKKRKFNETPEPEGKKEGSADALRFVVQKHNASHLHYDFRLEMQGVLKSWAVPKGPSMNPDDKRLAMMVEDHPYAYKNFEGIIPEGNYGAGTVIVWDEGTYEPAEPVKGGKAAMEKKLLQELHKGELKIILHGHKLKGEFVLVRTKGRGDNAWLLIKKRDKYAQSTDITKKDKSVVSGSTIEKVAKNSTNEWHSNRTAKNTSEKENGHATKKSTPWYLRNKKEENGSAAIEKKEQDDWPASAAKKSAVRYKRSKKEEKNSSAINEQEDGQAAKKSTPWYLRNKKEEKENGSPATGEKENSDESANAAKRPAPWYIHTKEEKNDSHPAAAKKTATSLSSKAKKSKEKEHASAQGRKRVNPAGIKKSLKKEGASATSKKTASKRSTGKVVKKKFIDPRVKQGIPTPFPKEIRPMLATLTDRPFDDPDWIFEIKWDGYRAIAYLQNGKVELRSRKNISFNEKYPPVVEALEAWDVHAVIDGEIISLNEKGRSDFQQLQIWQKEHKGKLQYYAFDILWLDGYSLTDLPLVERKAILSDIIPPDDPVIKYSDHVKERGKEFFNLALREGLEGIMAKLAMGAYYPGARTQQWLKVKIEKRQEAIICGFTQPRRSRKLFGALVLGIYDKGELVYIGHTGSGFDEKGLKEIYKKLEPIITDKCPFKVKPITNMPCTWVKPKYVCEVKYTEWTKDDILRHPIFIGLREDKKPSEVTREEPVHADPEKIEEQELKKEGKLAKKEVKKDKPSPEKRSANRSAVPVSKARSSAQEGKNKHAAKAKRSTTKRYSPRHSLVPEDPLFEGDEKDQTITVNGHEIKCTNLNKLYWPKEKITKRDVLEYYHAIAPVILPYMKDRPQSLNRHPDGTEGPNFFQKDVTGKVADWLTTYTYVSESDGREKKFLVCTDEASLLYMANLGCIEMNPWHSRTVSPDGPDWCVVDLDPDKIDFAKVIETANVVKSVADELGMETFCKTSGSRGLHIYIPLGARYSYDQSRQLAELVVTLVNQQLPEFTSIERNPARRKGKIYLDFLQNRSIQTIAAPYSLRPRPGATVSAPLHWEEVKKGLSIADFNIFTIRDRIREIGDIFKGVLGKGINLEKVLKKAGSLTR